MELLQKANHEKGHQGPLWALFLIPLPFDCSIHAPKKWDGKKIFGTPAKNCIKFCHISCLIYNHCEWILCSQEQFVVSRSMNWSSPWIFSLGISWVRSLAGLVLLWPCSQTLTKKQFAEICAEPLWLSPVFQFGGSFKWETVLVDEVGVPPVLPEPRLPLFELGTQLLRSSCLLWWKRRIYCERIKGKPTLTFRKYSVSSGSWPFAYPSG